ncbi:hypothetical protein EDF54_3913 [Rathayibacter sp. PhB93]|jgi:hypothetical protein|nr:hypothetical protein EDF45_2382 [Rathayibacter sp. PhB186]ROQ00912.1 hypothetical protein EDF54_3913 [Rathayibacter sp. PhB93]ROQ60356.1 hypothetical protein EDF36_1492 [Rathayibacter sp. PhB152]ROS21531.1 hypothetical protein EDF22_3788 [Rathayibacter sp. PhB127]ROS50832.1 hypothetical protein EDF44_2666 [Rathayibacter sp. PhB185]TCL83061.1 hypothetical protein EDF49_104114 [Rathayibacter sp. PhB192]TCM28559.1 hypothetical protein EDF43_104115 [Rathayibacter sp. PhB179]TDQ07266.1 hypothe
MNKLTGTWSLGRWIFLGVGVILVAVGMAQILPALGS